MGATTCPLSYSNPLLKIGNTSRIAAIPTAVDCPNAYSQSPVSIGMATPTGGNSISNDAGWGAIYSPPVPNEFKIDPFSSRVVSVNVVCGFMATRIEPSDFAQIQLG